MVAPVVIAKRKIGPGEPCFVIAEAGVNHNGDMALAFRLIDAAVSAKADAVKFQSFKAHQLATAQAPKAEYQLQTTSKTESQLAMLERLELRESDHQLLIDYCAKKSILFLSTPFEEASADLLERFHVPAFKIPSGEITNLPFLAHVARKNKPMILSTGMSTLEEVRMAVEVIRQASSVDNQLILLHCVSNYPASEADVNLRAMDTLAEAFQVPVGYSDHTQGLEVAYAAVARGACLIEKHLTLDRSLPGPDQLASTEPTEFSQLIHGIRAIESALGCSEKRPAASELNVARVARKSLVAAKDLRAGTRLERDCVAVRRPGTGLPPSTLDKVIGRTVKADVAAGMLIEWENLS